MSAPASSLIDLQVTPLSEKIIQVICQLPSSWHFSTYDPYYRFKIERQIGEEPWKEFAIVDTAEPINRLDRNVTMGQNYRYRVTLQTPYGDSDPVVSEVVTPIDGWKRWQQLMFADPEAPEAQADAIHGGLSNFVRYGLGLDLDAHEPMDLDFEPGLPSLLYMWSSRSYAFAYTRRRPAIYPELTFTVERSTDGLTWIEETATAVIYPWSNELERVVYPPLDKLMQPTYYRVRVGTASPAESVAPASGN